MTSLLVWACTAATPVHLERRSAGLAVVGDEISRVEIRSPAGVPVLVRTFPRSLDRIELPVAWSQGGTWTVRTRSATGDRVSQIEVAAEPKGSLVEIEAPLGTDRVPVADGARLGIVVPPGAGQMIVSTTALRPGAVAITVDGRRVVDRALGTLERASAILPLGGHVEVRAPDRLVAFDVEPIETDPTSLARSLEMGDVSFPADRAGQPEIGRPPGRVTLAASWWQTLLAQLGLGARARDPYAAWTHVIVPLTNRGDVPLSLLVETKVYAGDGVDPAFRAPALGGNERQDSSRVLIRVPAATDATAIVPLYVDDALLRAAPPRERRIEVTAFGLGSSTPLATRSVPLAVRSGNAFASLGLVAAIIGAVAGNGLVALRLGRWLRAFPTGELMTTALFATLGFGLGTVTSLAGLLASAAVGPFSPIVVGIVDVVFRFSIGATLVTLVPRPGVVTLSILTEWLLGAMLLGNVNASDVLFVGDRVFLYETALYAFGITRSGAWRDEAPWARWLRLSLAFGIASACTSAVGLVLHMTLYRLYFADWYIALLIALPGFLYVAVAMLVAVPFAASLRRVAR
jgi:hypothetical protein